MKSQKILLAAALLSLGAASCQKDENVITRFTAGIEQSSKTHLDADGMTLKWDAGDEVMVYNAGDAVSGVVFTAANLRNGDAVADLVSNDGIAAGSQYYAIHPVGIAASASSVTLPAVQQSDDGSLKNFPMYAQSDNTVFHFQNLCGALKIHLEQSNVTIRRIEVITNTAINGTYTIGTTGGAITLSHSSGGSNSNTLWLNNVQPIDDGHDFYIYLPAGEYNGMQITFYQPDGSHCTKSGNVTIERSKYSPIEIRGGLNFDNPDLLNGLFSVSPTQKVRFAKGNLVSTTIGAIPNATNTTWALHENQYDVLADSNDVNGRCDLFGWSTAGTYYGLSTSTAGNDYSGDFVDWGDRIRSDGDAPWRTLSYDELYYLLFTRANALHLYGFATISDKFVTTTNPYYPVFSSEQYLTHTICGMVILPDDADWNSLNFTPGAQAYGSNNVYTAAQWEQMEAAGAIFLPSAGIRFGTDVSNACIPDGGAGTYWVSTQSDDPTKAYAMYFNGTNGVNHGPTFYDGRNNGKAVRLAQNAN